MDNKILMNSLTYVSLGLPIIPLCSHNHEGIVPTSDHVKRCKCMGKIPLTKWRDVTETHKQDVIGWKDRFSAFNVGLPLGSVTGFIGIDIDGAEGETILENLRAGRELPTTWEFTTGAGRRLIYEIPVGLKTKKSVNTGEGVHEECSILAEGQQTVLPPSIHHTGRRYEWLFGQSPMEGECAAAPNWLIDLVREEKREPIKRADKKVAELILNLEQDLKPGFADMHAAFAVGAFDASIPEDIDTSKAKAVKTPTTQEAPPMKSWQEMLLEPVVEGGRDNALTRFIGSILADRSLRAAGKEVIYTLACQYNVKCLDPPLLPEEILPKVELFWENEMTKTAGYAEMAEPQKSIAPMEIIQPLRNRLDTEGYCYVFDNMLGKAYYCINGTGPWKEDRKGDHLNNLITDIASEAPFNNINWVTPSKQRDVIELFRQRAIRDQGITENIFNEESGRADILQYLPVDGKLLDWHTKELKPWGKEFLSETNFEVGYDPEAKSPRWDKYLKDWMPDEATRNFLQEFLGQAMLPRADNWDKFLILLGGGSNGKSMFLETIQEVFGTKICSNSTLKKLSEKFGALDIVKKRLNICPELDGSFTSETGMLKSIISGDTISIEPKGKDSFMYKPIASLIFSTNELPRIGDASYGWARRQVIIPFDQVFEKGTKGTSMKERIKQDTRNERAGIFNWLLEGLRRSDARGHYLIPDAIENYSKEQNTLQNPVKIFLSKFVISHLEDSMDLATNKDKKPAAHILTAKYGKTKHGIYPKFLHALYECWYTAEINKKGKLLSFKAFDEQVIKLMLFGKSSQCYSITGEKMGQVYLGADYSFSDEMLDFMLELDPSETYAFLNTDMTSRLQVLHKMSLIKNKEREV